MIPTSRTVVVTGATRGLGLALVREFAINGWHTTGIGRSERPTDYPDGVMFERYDASDLNSCRDFWRRFTETHGVGAEGLALINNAGLYVRSRFMDTPPEVFEASMRANYLTGVHMTRTLFESVSTARIVNIISTSAHQARATNSAYGSAKAGLAQFFRSLQQEFPPTQYRISNIYPGYIRTHGEGPEIDATEPEDLSSFIRSIVEAPSSFYIAEATLMPKGSS